MSLHDLVPGTPGNADGNEELFLFDTTTGTITQITNTAGGFIGNSSPSINATGTRIAFVSNSDLVPGGNADGNFEIFLASSVAGPTPTIPTLTVMGMLLLGVSLAAGMATALRRRPPHLNPLPPGGERGG